MRSRIFGECGALHAEVEAENQTLSRTRHKLTLTLIGEALPVMIQHVVIREIVDRLG